VCEDISVRIPEGNNPSFGTFLRDTEHTMEVVFGPLNKVGDKEDIR
jgi:hypothetical protein